ncbi:glycoside hydrolase family 43 protein [Paenibacillus sp. HB172176]|uniref:glycoside hydrolase family 43 protein n=1 Tax=Paenibacillus sp. HB172176 TaxID=2493690 RepID=UPI0014394E68|nr:glycoside hydrolase family 43 protein [Paenibacillus sp. HB172176]
MHMESNDREREVEAARQALSGLPTLRQEKFRNPASVAVDSEKGNQGRITSQPTIMTHPDPYVLKHRGQYYSYATHSGGVTVLHSKDLLAWRSHGYAFQMEGQHQFWAPSVVYENGAFYMYVSCYPLTEEDAHYGTMKVAVSESPLGPFEYKKTLFDTFSIDSHVVKDEAGRYYLFYSNNEYSGTDPYRPGTVILVDRLTDMMTLEHEPKLVVEPSIEEEIFAVDRFGDGRDWHTIEGAFYFRRNGMHYVMYSGNAFGSPTYFLGLSAAKGQGGQEDLRELSWGKAPSAKTYRPLLQQNDQVEGAGHNSMVVGPNLIEEWVVYHGRAVKPAVAETSSEGDASTQSNDEEKRQMRLDRMLWQGDHPWIAGPSSEEQDAPAKASFMDHFDQEDGAPGKGWKSAGGQWEVRDGELLQTNAASLGTILTEHVYEHYVAELSLKAIDNHAGARYGFYSAYRDARNYSVIVLDKGRRTLEIYSVRNGIRLESEAASLPTGFQAKAYHEMSVEKTGRQLAVHLDGVLLLRAFISITEGRVGFFTQYAMASFSGFAITRSFKLERETAEEFAALLRAGEYRDAAANGSAAASGMMPQWTIEDGQLRHRNPGNEPSILLLDSRFTAGDFQFRMDWSLDHERQTGMLGFFPVYGNADHYTVFQYERNGHLLKHIQAADGISEIIHAINLPAAFDPMEEHCFWMKRAGEQTLILLDQTVIFHGKLQADLTKAEPELSASVGILASGEAAFRHIEVIY